MTLSARITPSLRTLSRRTPSTMPLRAKITNPAFRTMASSAKHDTPDADQVIFAPKFGVRSITLNRPSKLNALNSTMVDLILPRLQEFERSQLANVIVVKGSGEKSFCAGGDVASLANGIRDRGEDGVRSASRFFGEEYKLNHLIATYSKPYVAFMDGITMGGGVGLSIHAPFRVATERTVFAMPETTIGFFPDVGGSFFLPRLDGEIGTYLALTSERLTGIQAFHAGVASHYIHSSSLQDLEDRLAELKFPDNATLEQRNEVVNETIEEFVTEFPSEPFILSGERREAIDRCFRFNTVEQILDALAKEEGNQKSWAQKTIETIKARSAVSVRVALRQMREGKDWNISETFQREYFMASKFMADSDFVEGVSARLLERRDPNWSVSLEDTKEWEPTATPVTEPAQPSQQQQEVQQAKSTGKRISDKYFAIAGADDKLKLLKTGQLWKEYPRKNIGLPSESEIEREVRNARWTDRDLVLYLEDLYRGKKGLKQKVYDVIARKCRKGEDGRLIWREL